MNPLHKKILIVLFTALISAGLLSCHKNIVVSKNPGNGKLTEKSTHLVEADNAFGFNLFRKIRSANNEKNLLVSPFSISVALAMAYNGAEMETQAEMEKVMLLADLTREQINSSYAQLLAQIESLDEHVVFEIANALYYEEKFTVNPDFLSVTQKIYNAEVNSLNFSSPSAVATINNWVNEKTQGKIEEIIRQLKPLDRMVLLNAVYFNGTWSKEFDKNGTKNREFVKSGGTAVRVPMMNKLDTLPYFSAGSFKAIKLPYGNGQYSMVVILPHNENGLPDIVNSLSAENWKSWMNSFEYTNRVDVTMPRFKFEFETSLKGVLAEMGMQKAFQPKQADFSGISEEELYISEAKHKSYIDVNETGTEAAAVTSIGFSTTSLREEPPTVPFYVDKPFLFAITENQTGALLFLGEVQDPNY